MHMRKICFMLASLFMLAGCGKDATEMVNVGKKAVTFNVEQNDVTTRAGMSADGVEMTDLWVFDYMGDQLVGQVHQVPTDAAWGSPTLSLTYGEHELYFVASRGSSPSVSTAQHTIAWQKASDTFWKKVSLNVTDGTANALSVLLSRKATRLRIVVSDEVPANVASLVIRPGKWYNAMDYFDGSPVGEVDEDRTVSVPASMLGTQGQLKASIFGIGGSTEWTTTVSVSARDSENNIVGLASLASVPFIENRTTEFTGVLFHAGGSASVSLDDEWQPTWQGSW